MSFLQLENRTILLTGVANRKSIAWHVGQVLRDAGARVLYSVRDEEVAKSLGGLVPREDVAVCDVEKQAEIDRLPGFVGERSDTLHGIVHSIAYARYSGGVKPFHEVGRKDFFQALDVSSYSLIALSRALRELLDPDGSVVTLSIASTRVASSSYGYMGPVKAALESSLCYLAKSFSAFSRVRFNAVKAGPVKTSAAAGIPGFVDTYLYAEEMTLRKSSLQQSEIARTVAFLLSPASSGINAQGIVVDAGMMVNLFDETIVRRTTRDES